MGKITFVLGGARSGKSTFAENNIGALTDEVAYIATAIPFDDGMKARVAHHQNRRPKHWKTIERYKDMSSLSEDINYQSAQAVLLDCVTVMVTNLMLESGHDFDDISQTTLAELEMCIQEEFDALIELAKKTDQNHFWVSNEVGLGLVPPYKLGNYFRDIAGRVNQKLASVADDVYFVVSGIPMKIK